ncbi:MAG TPA: hypothetical protein VGR40_07620 [Candidatus Binatus sp.]|nr:hypothetical protein [Candidatus Binatus sp.]
MVALSARTDLNQSERREVMDGLCLCDFKIGRPTYSLAEQRGVCADAMKEPGSRSGSIIAQIDDAQRVRDQQEVKAALALHDIADAERAAIDYQRLPGADPVILARWSKEIWTLADEQVFADSVAKKRSLGAAVSAARKNHPDVAKMDKRQFAQWVEKTMTVSSTPLANNVEVRDSTLTLSVSEANMHIASLSLDRLATINDAMVARCGCDARTNVAVAETGFPAYFIRLDPETRISEVMILPRGDSPILSAASN